MQTKTHTANQKNNMNYRFAMFLVKLEYDFPVWQGQTQKLAFVLSKNTSPLLKIELKQRKTLT